MSYSSAITIEQLDSKLNTQATLTLVGGGLPKMGANWGLESGMSTTYYPGNPLDATQQFAVAKELPSEWTGEWNLTRLNRAPCSFSGQGQTSSSIVSPGFLVDVFESFQIAGQLLRVTWAVNSDDPNIARQVVRLGRIAKFNAKYTRSMDLEWECTFAWKSRGTQTARVLSSRDGDPNSASAGMLSAASDLADIVNGWPIISKNVNIPLSASQFSLGQLAALANYPQALAQGITQSIGRIVNQVAQVAAVVQQLKGVPAGVADTFVGLFRNTVDQANQFADSMSGVPAEQLTLDNDCASTVQAMQYFGQSEDTATVLASRAQDAQVQLQSVRAPLPGSGVVSGQTTQNAQVGSILGVYTTKTGDTPASISMKFFAGSPDYDLAILRANQLPYYQTTFEPGTILVIPSQPTAASF